MYKDKIRDVLFVITGKILGMIPKKNKLVLFTAWRGEKYIDNTKYVYEYMRKNTDYNAVWMTRNEKIYEELKKENKQVALFNSIKGIILQIRAKAVFSTIQFADYNCWLLSNCLYIDLGHGHPIKDPGKDMLTERSRKLYKLVTDKVEYHPIVASSRTKKLYHIIDIPRENIIVSDFARNDVLFYSELQKGKNQVVSEFKAGRKAIVYMPTQRSLGRKEMKMTEILPLDEIEDFCKTNNYVFIIKKHFYHRKEVEHLEKYKNIIDITNVDDIDPQVLLCQADLLISDYSACYIDFMLLKRPIIFYQYDIKDFIKNERTLYYDFEELKIAPIAYNQTELINSLSCVVNGKDEYLERRLKFAHEYYFDNIDQKEGRKKVIDIFDRLYKQYHNNA